MPKSDDSKPNIWKEIKPSFADYVIGGSAVGCLAMLLNRYRYKTSPEAGAEYELNLAEMLIEAWEGSHGQEG